ncbi:MAG: hypothetical protein IPN94_24245 [Sphingobacteriales bacterium]|nr:hypothetical protein [Sphingobacteriales bacterium]
MFISPFFKLVNLKSANYKVFTQRPMSVKYNNDQKTSDGLVDFMLAKGKTNTPENYTSFTRIQTRKNAAITTHSDNC